MKKGIIIVLLCLFAMFSIVTAHQPRITIGSSSSETSPFIINNPAVSQAFYGNLNGQADYYSISSAQNFSLYLNILAPNISNAREDFIVQVFKDNVSLFLLNSTKKWEVFYEEFGGDYYLRGPEIDINVSAGNYLIKVSNPSNQGKYSIAVGKIESFPLNEAINAFISMPALKTKFFDKSIFLSYYNRIGLFLAILLIILILIIILIIYFIKKSRK